MNNPEKLATKDTQDQEKQNKNTTGIIISYYIPRYDNFI
jgi:hypothetical protein